MATLTVTPQANGTDATYSATRTPSTQDYNGPESPNSVTSSKIRIRYRVNGSSDPYSYTDYGSVTLGANQASASGTILGLTPGVTYYFQLDHYITYDVPTGGNNF